MPGLPVSSGSDHRGARFDHHRCSRRSLRLRLLPDTGSEAKNLMLATGDLTDITYSNGMLPVAYDLIEDGCIYDLTEYLPK